ncbi:hypothetical protein DQ04_01251030 [Trypanosoma grayi]|uniref:hypothetical protein n=1 Tax=Trypanosoma grayi TaxID=71804 RepID=UPI0004F4A6BB|nr:hypothetical protein DQ04_01251030 [Trypanosoma grayi]KEG13030.1 hypothetical protein DQ04_01251030 [Trypanosoma grayi]
MATLAVVSSPPRVLGQQLPLLPLLLLLLCLTSTSSALSTSSYGAMSLAGSVSVPLNASQYVEVQAVDGASGAVLRSVPLDATRSFAFAGLPPTVAEIRLFLRMPERRFRLNTAASRLSVPIPMSSSGGVNHDEDVLWVELTAAVEEIGGTVEEQQGSVLTAVVVTLCLALAAVGKHRLVALLDLPTVKIPKPRRMIVAASR